MSRSGGNFRDGLGNAQRSVPRSSPVLNTRGPAPSTRGFLSSSGISDAHFARKQREAEDIRHARMLHSILHRPYRASVGAFTNAKDHAFYSRTLAMRMKNARLYKEFRRQKDNLLLLQRLQQIHFYEHPSRTKVGKNYSKEWMQHQEKHDAARRRLTARPRMGNSLIFAKGNRESPLSPRNRVGWEGRRDHTYQDTTIYRDVNDPTSAIRERVGRAIGTSSSSHNSDMIFSRGRPGSDKPTSPNHSSHVEHGAPDDRSSLAEKLAYERQRIEQELQKRWQAFGDDHPDAHAFNPDDEAVGEDEEKYEEPDPALLEWERDLELPPEDVEDEGLSQLLRNRSATSSGYEGLNLPHPILQDYSNYHLSSFPVGVPKPSYLPLSSNPAPNGNSGPYPPPPDTSRRQAMRARYIDEEESEVSELDEDGDDAGEQASAIASSALTSSNSRPSSASTSHHHRRHHSKRSSTGSGVDAGNNNNNSRLYNLAMHSGLDEGDRELQAYRLHQWEMSLPPELRNNMSRSQHAPHPPPIHPQPPSARSRPGSAQHRMQQQPHSARGDSSRPQSASSPRQPAAASAGTSSRDANELDDVLATLSAWDRDHESQSAAESLRIEAIARQRNRDRELSYAARALHNSSGGGTIDEGDEDHSSSYANEDEEAAIKRARMKRGTYQQSRPPRASSAAVSRDSAKKKPVDRDLSEDADRYFQQLKEEFPSSRRPAAEPDDPPPSFLQDTFTNRVTYAQSKAQIAANRSRSKQSKNRLEPAVRPR